MPIGAWDRFWKYDRLSSFETGRGSGNYGSDVRQGWAAFFEQLPDAPTILDLCTGNGAVAVLAAQSRARATVIGVDQADIDPARYCSTDREILTRVRFQGRVSAESLPFDDGSFDAIVSQFGIEYSDMDRSVTEVLRVLRPGGMIRLAIHASEGAVVRDTHRSLDDADFLLGDRALMASAMTSYASLSRYEGGEREISAIAAADYGAFRDALSAADSYERKAIDRSMMRSVRAEIVSLFNDRKTADPDEALARLSRLRSEIEDHRERQRALVAASKTREQIDALAAELTRQGFATVDCSTQQADGDIIAHVIEAS